LPPHIIVKGVKEFISVRSELVDLMGSENFLFKSTINNLRIPTKNLEPHRAIIIYFSQDANNQFHMYRMQ